MAKSSFRVRSRPICLLKTGLSPVSRDPSAGILPDLREEAPPRDLPKLELLDESPLVPGAKRGSEEEFIQSGAHRLSVQLDVINPIVDLTGADDSFQLLFTIYNPSDQDVTFCIRDTPLEGVMSKIFVVRSPVGKEMAYRGKDVKRDATPSADEYHTSALFCSCRDVGPGDGARPRARGRSEGALTRPLVEECTSAATQRDPPRPPDNAPTVKKR